MSSYGEQKAAALFACVSFPSPILIEEFFSNNRKNSKFVDDFLAIADIIARNSQNESFTFHDELIETSSVFSHLSSVDEGEIQDVKAMTTILNSMFSLLKLQTSLSCDMKIYLPLSEVSRSVLPFVQQLQHGLFGVCFSKDDQRKNISVTPVTVLSLSKTSILSSSLSWQKMMCHQWMYQENLQLNEEQVHPVFLPELSAILGQAPEAGLHQPCSWRITTKGEKKNHLYSGLGIAALIPRHIPRYFATIIEKTNGNHDIELIVNFTQPIKIQNPDASICEYIVQAVIINDFQPLRDLQWAISGYGVLVYGYEKKWWFYDVARKHCRRAEELVEKCQDRTSDIATALFKSIKVVFLEKMD